MGCTPDSTPWLQPPWSLCVYPPVPSDLSLKVTPLGGSQFLLSRCPSAGLCFVTSVSPGPAWHMVEGHTAPACWMSGPLCSPGDEGEQDKLLPALSFEHSGGFGTPCQQQPPKLYTRGRRWALGSPGKQCLGSGRGCAGGENWLESGLPFAGCVTAGRWRQLSGHHGASQ